MKVKSKFKRHYKSFLEMKITLNGIEKININIQF